MKGLDWTRARLSISVTSFLPLVCLFLNPFHTLTQSKYPCFQWKSLLVHWQSTASGGLLKAASADVTALLSRFLDSSKYLMPENR
ncbi:hypothetical protein BJ741DRAFT_587567 [Chytriomyces cf. hyalinus JEL632]|nr:hypothetical protein BJ741DRAFT_587567 [Chytriomyces cf. hyalinus JEL632]